MKLRELVSQAVNATASDVDGGLEPQEIYSLLDSDGPANAALRNPENAAALRPGFHPRPVPFSGDERVEGEFLTLDFCGHDPSCVLRYHTSLSEIEDFVLSQSGILNPFTTYMLAFVKGVCRKYTVTYEGDGGARLAFDKLSQVEDPHAFGKVYPNASLEWAS